MTDRDRPGLGGRGLHLEPRQVRGQWIVEGKLAGVAEDEERAAATLGVQTILELRRVGEPQ